MQLVLFGQALIPSKSKEKKHFTKFCSFSQNLVYTDTLDEFTILKIELI